MLSAIQFLTKIPVPSIPYDAKSLSRSVKFFPAVGMLVGAFAALLNLLFVPHVSRSIAALLVVTGLVLLTGCFHEDGLADAADGLGGGWNKEQVLLIFRDSRIGSYGATALTMSLLARVLLISALPLTTVGAYLISAHVLCRWTTLPLSYYMASARAQTDGDVDGQGARIANLTTMPTLIGGTLFSFTVAALLLRRLAVTPILVVVVATLLSGIYYKKRIDGVTGDCFGATNQIAEIAVYLCGVWIV
jgi:adenosylcobinamide-GDP ribazoletransferase